MAEPLPHREALAVASRLAEALQDAHNRGVVHGQVRPSAIIVNPDRSVRLLAPRAVGGPDAQPRAVEYASPEQIRGRAVDRRADIFSFGCVLFEMLSGAPAFAGDTHDAARAAVVERHPDWSRLPQDIPSRIVNLLKHCLQKDPHERLHDIADARIEIDATLRTDTEFLERGAPARSRGWRAGWVAAGVVIALAGWPVWHWLQPGAAAGAGPTPARVLRAVVPVPSGTTLSVGRGASIAIAPDGGQIVYVGEAHGTTQLYRRALDRVDAEAIAGTAGAADPFFSPDGRWIGFVAGENLMKVPAEGGAAVTIADAPTQRGVAWGADDTLFVTPRDNTGLWRVPASGGMLEQVTTLAEGDASHRWPQVLPGGTAVMYTVWNGAWDPAHVVVQPLRDGQRDPDRARRTIVTGGGFARYLPGPTAGQGQVIYASGERLMSVPFDLSRLDVSGEPRPIANGLITNFSGGAQLAVSPGGLLAYVTSPGEPDERDLAWVTRDGKTSPAARIRGLGRWYDLSADGRRIVRYKNDGPTRDVWIDDLATGSSAQVSRRGEPSSSGPTDRLNAIWSPDGRYVIYAAGLPLNLYLAAADGTGGEQRLTTSANTQWPGSWSSDGRLVTFVESHPQSGSDLWLLSLNADRRPDAVRPLVSTPFNDSAPMISPEGRWLAYQSNETGRYEIYVQPFPDGGRRIPVSSDGGVYPRWSTRGDELFFRSGDARAGLSAAAVNGEGGFRAPQRLFELRRFESIFEVAPDAQRFLMMPAATNEAAPANIHIVANPARKP